MRCREELSRSLAVAAVVAAGLACGCACGDGEEDEGGRGAAPITSAPTTSSVPEGSHETRAPDPRLPPAELGMIEGAVTIDRATAVSGAAVEAGRLVSLEGPGRATLELPGGARATLWSEGALLVAEAPDRGVWIVEGVVHVSDPPMGLGARTPMRVATPTATVELQGAGDVVLAVDATGVTSMTVLNGAAEVTSSEVDGRHRLRVVEVVAGLETRVVTEVAEPTQGSARLDDALAAARAAVMPAVTPPPAGAPVPASFATTTSRLDEAMRWLELEERRGRDLTARHRAAVQAGQRDEAMQYQREIVGHAQAVHALRQVVIVRWERFALTARVGVESSAAREDVHARLERLRNLLGS